MTTLAKLLPRADVPDSRGKFGPYGGQFVPETLMPALEELIAAYEEARHDPAFLAEFQHLLATYVGRPSPITHARRLSETLGGAQIYLKREDLNHTGAHQINNALDGWANVVSSPRPAPASMASVPRPLAPC